MEHCTSERPLVCALAGALEAVAWAFAGSASRDCAVVGPLLQEAQRLTSRPAPEAGHCPAPIDAADIEWDGAAAGRLLHEAQRLTSQPAPRAGHCPALIGAADIEWGIDVQPETETESWAANYFIQVMKGILVRHVAAESLPEEVRELGTFIRHADDFRTWARLRGEAEGAWHEYIARALPVLRRRAMTGIPARSRLVAAIIEPRCHGDLEFALRQTLAMLGPDWALVIFHGVANEAYVQNLVHGWDHVHLVSLGTDNLTREAYANLRRSSWLFDVLEGIGAEKVLFFECDGVLVRPGVEQFFRYPNTGAPWHWGILEQRDTKVGNGGVCLRDVRWCRRALGFIGASGDGAVADRRYKPREEDISYSQAAFDMGADVAPPGLAAAFCVETIFHPAPLAVHKPWPYILPSDLRAILGLPRGDYYWRAVQAWREAGWFTSADGG